MNPETEKLSDMTMTVPMGIDNSCDWKDQFETAVKAIVKEEIKALEADKLLEKCNWCGKKKSLRYSSICGRFCSQECEDKAWDSDYQGR